MKGHKTDTQASAGIKAELQGLLGKLAGANAAAKVAFSQEDYENYSQDALSGLAEGDRQCRERIFNKMFDKLSPTTTPGQREWTFHTAQPTEAEVGSGNNGKNVKRETLCTPGDGLAFLPSSAVERDWVSHGNSDCHNLENYHNVQASPQVMTVTVEARPTNGNCHAYASLNAEVKVIAKDGTNRTTPPAPLATCQTGAPQ